MIPNLNYTGSFTDVAALTHHLAQSGLGADACAAKAELFARAAAVLGESTPHVAIFVPGRIEVLGKHTDYAGGRSLVCATERGFCIVGSPRPDAVVEIFDTGLGETARVPIDPELVPELGHWRNYPQTTIRRIARNFPGARRGARLALASDLPPAAGMSSSSAFMVAIFLALAAMNDLESDDGYQANIRQATDLAGYLGTVENGQTFGTLVGDRGVGTFGGSEDHTAMLCGRSRMLSLFSYRPVHFKQAYALPEGLTFAVASSGVVAEKTRDALEKYNRVSRLVMTLEELWAAHHGERVALARLLDSTGALPALDRLVDAAPEADALHTRLRHFLLEDRKVIPDAAEALARGDRTDFGRAVLDSQRGCEELLGNQVPETVHLAASARENGAVAASAFGAGFGGSVWALVDASTLSEFLSNWELSYQLAFPAVSPRSAFFSTTAGPAAFRIR